VVSRSISRAASLVGAAWMASVQPLTVLIFFWSRSWWVWFPETMSTEICVGVRVDIGS
jgi:hypothetical protein